MSTSLYLASSKFEKYLARALEDGVRSGAIDEKKRNAMGSVGAFLVPVYQKGITAKANVKRPGQGPGSSARATGGQLQKLGLGYKPTPGQGPGSDQEDDKRVDLRLGGRGLGDDVIKCVFQALSKARLIAYVRDIDVHANDLTCEGVVAMCDAFLGSSAGAGKGSRKGSRRLSQLSTGLGLGE